MFLTSRQYRVPAGDGEALIDPPFAAIWAHIEALHQRELARDLRPGLALAAWRMAARAEVAKLIGRSLPESATWFVAGHQPEFFHPGVWLKSAVLSQLAGKHGGFALNLIVDNDVPKTGAIRLPIWRPGIAADAVAVDAITYCEPAADVPFEEWSVQDAALFASFPERLARATSEWPFEPIGLHGWHETTGRVMDAITKVRHVREVKWGQAPVDLHVSKLCSTTVFGEFAYAIVNDLPRFHECYNSQVRGYRQLHGIKSRHHPVPELIQEGDWFEAPFWCWSSEDPKRARPFVRVNAAGMRLRWRRREFVWPSSDVKIRPRALTLTMFARLALADLFIHGIGGGKYDELTDAISASFFGAMPPEFMLVSGTLRLPLPTFPATWADQIRLQRRERDWQWNPQRLLVRTPLAAERAELIALPTTTRQQRRERRRRLRKNLQRWQNLTATPRLAEITKRTQCENELRANHILTSREYAWPLYPDSLLKDWLQRRRD